MTARGFKLIQNLMQTPGEPAITSRIDATIIPTASSLVQRLGPHPADLLGLDLETAEDSALGGWLLASGLFDARTDEAHALAAWRRLEKEGLSSIDALGSDALPRVVEHLKQARIPKPEQCAASMIRLAEACRRAHGGSLGRLAASTDGLEALATQLVRLAPGFGPARVARFLRPLRDVWTGVDELPLDPAALAAAVHLGWAERVIDPESGPTRLRRVLQQEDTPPPIRDLEAALERLGRASCRRNRVERCPLAEQCPARGDSPTSSC
jgi:endonuclease III